MPNKTPAKRRAAPAKAVQRRVRVQPVRVEATATVAETRADELAQPERRRAQPRVRKGSSAVTGPTVEERPPMGVQRGRSRSVRKDAPITSAAEAETLQPPPTARQRGRSTKATPASGVGEAVVNESPPAVRQRARRARNAAPAAAVTDAPLADRPLARSRTVRSVRSAEQADVQVQQPAQSSTRRQREEIPSADGDAVENEPPGAASDAGFPLPASTDPEGQLALQRDRDYSRRSRQASTPVDISDEGREVLRPPRRRVRFDTSFEAGNNCSQELDEHLSSYVSCFRNEANYNDAATVARRRALYSDDELQEAYRAGLAARGQLLTSPTSAQERTSSTSGVLRRVEQPSASEGQRAGSTALAENGFRLAPIPAAARGHAQRSSSVAQDRAPSPLAPVVAREREPLSWRAMTARGCAQHASTGATAVRGRAPSSSATAARGRAPSPTASAQADDIAEDYADLHTSASRRRSISESRYAPLTKRGRDASDYASEREILESNYAERSGDFVSYTRRVGRDEEYLRAPSPTVESGLAYEQRHGGDRAEDRLVRALERSMQSVARSNATGDNLCLVNRMTSAKQLPSFSGDPLDWVRFKQAFICSTKLGRYSDSENIMRLSDALKGEAREGTRALFFGGDSAEEIIKTLEMMFGNSKLILARILREIGDLPKIESRRVSLVEFATRLRAAVRAIKSLDGNAGYLNSPELASKLMDKLPSAMCHSYVAYSDNVGVGVSDLEKIADFVYREAVMTVNAGVIQYESSQSSTTSKVVAQNSRNRGRGVFVAQDSEDAEVEEVSPKRNGAQCAVCDRAHNTDVCRQFEKLPMNKRWQTIRKTGRCYNCLGAGHLQTACKKPACVECGRRHHALLHQTAKNAGKPVDKVDSNQAEQ